MSKQYPPHPGQTHASPFYTQLPLEEYEALMKENKALKQANANMTESIAELDAMRQKEVELDMRERELKEERRWRKFPDEKPSEEGYYIICGSSGFRNSDKWTYCEDRRKMDFSFYSYGVKYWMPMPSAPEEASK